MYIHKTYLCRGCAAYRLASARTVHAYVNVLLSPFSIPAHVALYPSLLHVPATVSADFRLIVDTGSPENIHNNAADLFDTSPSNKVIITADGTRVPAATCVGKLPLILTDTLGCQSFFILDEVHAIPSFEYTLLSVANLVSNDASV